MSGKPLGYKATLSKCCPICEQMFFTQSNTPFKRKIKGKTVYYCSYSCKQSSYMLNMDGHADERKAENEKKRYQKRKEAGYFVDYRAENRDRERQRSHDNYHRDIETSRAKGRFYYRKKKLLQQEVTQ